MRIRQHYDEELQALHRQLNEFGDIAVAAVNQALEALRRQDVNLARTIVASDVRANETQHRLDAHAVMLIATQQPVARDLRKIMAAISVGSELERIADYAKGIARFVVGADGAPPLEPPAALLALGDAAAAVLTHAIAALRTLDAEAARGINGEEDQVDRLYEQALASIAEVLATHPGGAKRAADLLFIAHDCERIADRSTNIAEQIIYYVSGETVKLNP